MNYPQYILDKFLNTVFPIRCIRCGKFSDETHKEYLCLRCTKDIPVNKGFECIGCSASSSLGKTCFECRKTNYIDNLFITSDYKASLTEQVIKLFKYRLIKDMHKPIDFAVEKYLSYLNKDKKYNILNNNPLFIPIPLHYRRLNWRGFNQAELIAQSLANFLNIDIATDILTKTGPSKPQAKIKDRPERLANTIKMFQISTPYKVRGRNIVLIDDVCTTGATLNECAKILKKAGAQHVSALVFARG